MLSLFFIFSHSTLATYHIGEPKSAIKTNDGIYVATKDNFMAYFEKDEEKYVFTWRLRLPPIEYFTVGMRTIAVTKHYVYVLSNETGHIHKQVPHHVRNVKTADFYNRSIVIKGENKIALYNLTHELWSIDHKEIEEGEIRFIEDGTKIAYGTKTFDAATGASLSQISTPTKLNTIQFKYEPTVLEFIENGEVVHRREEPLYGAKAHTIISKFFALLSNKTHLIIFRTDIGKIHKVLNCSVEKIVPYINDTYLVKANDGLYLYKEFTLTPYSTKIDYAYKGQDYLKLGKTNVVLPPNCSLACMQVSGSNKCGSVFLVYQCPDSTQSVIVNQQGKILSNYETTRKLGNCFQTQHSYHMSTYTNRFDKPFLHSFNKEGAEFYGFNTPAIAIDTSDNYILYKGGRLEKISSNEINYIPKPHEIGFLSSMKDAMSGKLPVVKDDPLEPASEQISYSFLTAKKVIDKNDVTIVQGYDLWLVQDETSSGYELEFIIIGIYIVIALIVGYGHYSTKVNFWK